MSPTNHPPPPTTSPPPPWEVLFLVAHRLDPRTLAVASCVCKSWAASMSSDALWEPLCSAHYPSLSGLRSADPSLPFRRLFSLGLTASARRRRIPPPPRLSLDSFDFVVDIRSPHGLPLATLTKPGEELRLELGPNNLFQFDIENNSSPEDYSSLPVPVAAEENNILPHVRVTWNVVVKGWEGVFTMMDGGAEVGLISGAEGWFSEELPAPAEWCCVGGESSGVVADVKVVVGGGGQRLRVEKAKVGMLSGVRWRYLTVDDGLRYLQHFLGPIEVDRDI